MSDTLAAMRDHSPGKLITCIVPANGMDKVLIKGLKERYGVLTADSYPCRGFGGQLGGDDPLGAGALRPRQACVVMIVVSVEQADAVFDFLGEMITRETFAGGVLVMQGSASHVTRFELPVGIPDEFVA
ncbi:MAG: hypothetical protein HQL07_13995 [Nitrospirae bacterium]|nr:hypothetical protein [Magnetococcales bacterium]HAT50253.1 hypothetical protein [Alphaproteobacteria bacterium]